MDVEELKRKAKQGLLTYFVEVTLTFLYNKGLIFLAGLLTGLFSPWFILLAIPPLIKELEVV